MQQGSLQNYGSEANNSINNHKIDYIAMCFSTTASFSAGVVLNVIGFATLKKMHHKSQLLFAAIPLIFGVPQLAEGALRVELPDPELWIKMNISDSKDKSTV